jgi:hypothetical protein
MQLNAQSVFADTTPKYSGIFPSLKLKWDRMVKCYLQSEVNPKGEFRLLFRDNLFTNSYGTYFGGVLRCVALLLLILALIELKQKAAERQLLLREKRIRIKRDALRHQHQD